MDSDNTTNYSYLYIGMSGRDMTNVINDNFRNTDSEFSDIKDELDIRVISDTIKYIKLENEIISYSEDNENWHSINVWGAIKGDITNQTDLRNALNDKVSSSTFNTLNNKVNKNTEDILDLSDDTINLSNKVDTLDDTINNETTGILVRLDDIDTAIESKVSSPQIKAIRSTDGTHVDFTTNGTTWKSIFDGTISWGNITGNISNQSDLNQLFNNIEDSIQDIENDLNSLENRVSDIEDELNNTNSVVYMTENDYRNLSPKNENTIYIVSPS